MFNAKHLLAKLLLAVSLAGGAGMANAGAIYHYVIDTAAFSGTTGFLNLYFQGLGNATPATATVSNFVGAFVGPAEFTGDVSGDMADVVTFGNSGPLNELVQMVDLGGKFSFSASFEMDEGSTGTNFGVALFNLDGYLGADGDLSTISLQPGAPAGQQITFTQTDGIAGVTAVPEPSDWLLMLTAMGALVMVRRRSV